MRTLKLSALLTFVSTCAFAGPPKDSLQIEKQIISKTRITTSDMKLLPDSLTITDEEIVNDMNSGPGYGESLFTPSVSIPNYFGKFGTTVKDGKKGVGQDKLKVSGILRMVTIYRNMQESYDDMITADRNISFLDYPLQNIGAANGGGYPMLEISMGADISKRFSYTVGYSFAHSFLGETDGDAGKALSSRQNLLFTGNYNTKFTKINLSAGGIMWTSLSRFTMGQPNYRDDYFTRVPWDWHKDSWTRYQEYYDYTANIGAEAAGRSPLKGFVMNGAVLPWAFNWTVLYGRTNRSAIQANQISDFPSQTYGARIAKNVFERNFDGDFGLNYYKKDADIDRTSGTSDDQEMLTTDFKIKTKGFKVESEFGVGRIVNPNTNGDWGTAFAIKGAATKKAIPIPVSLEYYNISHNVASLDGSILNSNVNAEDGGVANEYLYDNMLYVNLAQEVGMIANNRQGITLKSEAKVGNLKIEVALAASQEKENLYDTITIQHRVNAFSRSRFRPWFQAGGNYGRIKSFWLRTFETLTITDEPSGVSTDYKKGFSGLDVFLKYKARWFNKNWVLLSFSNFNSIQDRFSIIPQFNADNAFVAQMYEDLTLACEVRKGLTLEGNFGVEKVVGGTRIQMADANGIEITSGGVNVYDANGFTMDQIGYAYGFGIDYDFTKTAGIHLRHKWMTHEDKAFTNDKFKGHETTFELKIFF